MRIPFCVRRFFLALAAWVVGSGLAFGHSGLQRAEPPVESTLRRPPSEVKLYFNERLEPAYSTLQVKDDHGTQVDRLDAHVDPSNLRVLRGTLQPLERGAYAVSWRVLSVDGHVTEGHFTFQVK
jgi:methionine-rich copper-binding protein CopC